MTAAGLTVSPSAIARYGNALGEQRGQLERVHDTLVSDRLPADAFGLLGEADGLYQAYQSHAGEVLSVLARLPDHIGEVAAGLLDTARGYADLEDSMAQGIGEIFAPVDFPVPGGYRYSEPSSSDGHFLGDAGRFGGDAYQAYLWTKAPETALPALAVQNLDPAASGLTGALSEAVTWLLENVPVLPKYLNDVTGNLQALKASAAVWHGMGEELNLVTAEMKRNAADLPASWAGQGSESFGAFMGNVVQALDILTGLAGQTQRVLEDAAAAASFAQNTLSMIISEVLEWIAGNILVDIATAGLATGVEALASADFLADKVTEAGTAAAKLADVLTTLRKVLESLKFEQLDKGYEALQKAESLDKVRKFLALGKTFQGSLKYGKLINLASLNDGKLAAVAEFAIDTGFVGSDSAKFAEAAKLGKLGLSSRVGANAMLAAAEGLTGLPTAKDGAGLAKDLAKGALKDLRDNGQGAADAVEGAEPEMSETARRLNALLNPHMYPREEKK